MKLIITVLMTLTLVSCGSDSKTWILCGKKRLGSAKTML
ncbi:hypothetical protein SAMN06296036_1067 [Pseudobacteriovorax antillogorgiicola]|uniref:Lipoprotein n=1 Tax=Pseudobacteriovorax antillogorgiicola TaxID=1513793 RepID=A0A1Y6BQN7_9BACT|nr:hypothetical protein EDD56_106236 [Pseudobacteriovorax antillogorgiicola]SMF15965.1 hypothetical protein SAMN06296036_1067 [Pseudobacteriovorax antillogorgiicola]